MLFRLLTFFSNQKVFHSSQSKPQLGDVIDCCCCCYHPHFLALLCSPVLPFFISVVLNFATKKTGWQSTQYTYLQHTYNILISIYECRHTHRSVVSHAQNITNPSFPSSKAGAEIGVTPSRKGWRSTQIENYTLLHSQLLFFYYYFSLKVKG